MKNEHYIIFKGEVEVRPSWTYVDQNCKDFLTELFMQKTDQNSWQMEQKQTIWGFTGFYRTIHFYNSAAVQLNVRFENINMKDP